jgi:uncharacterized protein (DUF58 family)
MILNNAISFIKAKTAKSKNTSKIYILPTLIGVYFFATAVLQLIMGVVFSNNLILLFGLMLLIFGILTAVITNFHLENIELTNLNIFSGHQNFDQIISLTFSNKLKKQELSGLKIIVKTKEKKELSIPLKSLKPGLQKVTHQFKLPRGKYHIETIVISTQYPLNLFESWKNQKSSHNTFFVYPEKLKSFTKQDYFIETEFDKGRKTISAEFSHLEKFQPGDPINRIDWKVFARTEELYKKVFQDHMSPQQKFLLKEPITEKSLSEISTLISHAYENNHQWELESTDTIFHMDSGKSHFTECQRYLSEKEVNEKTS